MKCIFNSTALSLPLFLFLFVIAPITARAQIIDREHIQTLVEDGKIETAIQNLEKFLGPEIEISRDDSAFALRYLGMIHAGTGKIEKAKDLFKSLFAIEPTASIRNTDASYDIVEVFIKAKNEFKKEHGGEILRPKVVVLDALGPAIEDQYRGSIARQFIEELQRLWLFEALNRNEIAVNLENLRLSADSCRTEACYLNLAKQIDGDKLVLLNFDKAGQVYALNLRYIDVFTGKTESILKRAAINNLDTLILSGLQELAVELERENAAWLQFSLEPAGAYLELNSNPTDGEKRIPVMPGKHKVCASAPGYQEMCKTLEVKPRDGLTHRLALVPDISAEAELPRPGPAGSSPQAAPGSRPSVGLELWILGGLGLLTAGLVVLFSL